MDVSRDVLVGESREIQYLTDLRRAIDLLGTLSEVDPDLPASRTTWSGFRSTSEPFGAPACRRPLFVETAEGGTAPFRGPAHDGARRPTPVAGSLVGARGLASVFFLVGEVMRP